MKNILTDTNVTYIMTTDTKVTYNLHNRHKSTSKLIHNCHKKYEKRCRKSNGLKLSKLRNDEGFLPIQTKFLILPDPEGKRVGSGGATLNVLRAIAEELVVLE